MLTQQQNSPPAATSKTSPTWCRITNSDKKKDGRWQSLCKTTELCVSVCVVMTVKEGSMREEEKKKKKGRELQTDYDPQQRLSTPAALTPRANYRDKAACACECVRAHKCVYFPFHGAKCMCDSGSHTCMCIQCLLSGARHFLFPTVSPLCALRGELVL